MAHFHHLSHRPEERCALQSFLVGYFFIWYNLLMKLFLSGGGDTHESFELDKRYIEAVDRSKPILYIPIAMPQEVNSYPNCLKWIKNNFKPFGFDNFVMWTEEDLKTKKESDFEQFGSVYIGGGNTFKLLDDLKKFGTFEILAKLAEQNIPIYGGSAGAIIFGPTISTAIDYDPNDIGLVDLSGFNITYGYEIWCHYDFSKENEKGKPKEYMTKYNLSKMFAMPNDMGILVTDKSIEFIGRSKAWIFEGEKEVEVGGGYKFDIITL